MSLFTKLGETIGGSGEDEDAESASAESDDAAESVEMTGPNFMPEKQKRLYLKAHANAEDLSTTGVCSDCGTTLRPIKAERLFAACKNEDCENYLRETEVTAVKRYEDRHGVPEEIDGEDDDPMAARDDESGDSESALDGLSDAIGDE